MRRTVLAAFAATALAVTVSACSTSRRSAAPTGPHPVAARRAELPSRQRHYGGDIHLLPGERLQPAVVVIDHGAEAVRSVTGDGLIWTMDPRAPGVDHLSPGKIMMATGLGVGRVAALRRTSAGEQVVLIPVPPTAIFRDLHLSGDVPLKDALYYQMPGPAGTPPDADRSPHATHVRRLTAAAGPHPLPTPPTTLPTPPALPDIPFPPPLTGPSTVTAGGGQLAAALDDAGLHVHVQYQHGRGRFDAELTLQLQAPSVHFYLDIGDGRVQRLGVRLEGAGGVRVKFTAADEDETGNVANHVIPIPVQLAVPLGGGFQLSVTQEITTTVQLAGRAVLATHGSYGISGRLDFGLQHGAPYFGTATAVRSDSLAHHVLSLGVAAGAVRLRWSIRAGIGVGLGVLNASAWYGLGFNAALEGNGLANDHPGCVQGRVYLTNQFGLSYHVLPVVMKVVNAILSLFGVPKIPADGGIEGGAPLGPGLRGEYCP